MEPIFVLGFSRAGSQLAHNRGGRIVKQKLRKRRICTRETGTKIGDGTRKQNDFAVGTRMYVPEGLKVEYCTQGELCLKLHTGYSLVARVSSQRNRVEGTRMTAHK